MEQGIVRPLRGRSSPTLGSLAVMAATRTDFSDLCRLLGRDPRSGRRLYTSRLILQDGGPAVIGPMVGAPYAAMVMETLIAWGANRFVFVGWCGTISPELPIGALLLPDAALIDEGTSVHYPTPGASDKKRCAPSARMQGSIAAAMQTVDVGFRTGAVWSTDAIFRETPSQVLRFRQMGAVAVEMEASALFSVGRFRGVEVGAAMVVSDDLSELVWRHGFHDPRFERGRQALCEGIAALCRTM
ncbi:MAG: nucleoside phosphorylase [Desulfobacterales bacterium]